MVLCSFPITGQAFVQVCSPCDACDAAAPIVRSWCRRNRGKRWRRLASTTKLDSNHANHNNNSSQAACSREECQGMSTRIQLAPLAPLPVQPTTTHDNKQQTANSSKQKNRKMPGSESVSCRPSCFGRLFSGQFVFFQGSSIRLVTG